jgi:hypothetical protein
MKDLRICGELSRKRHHETNPFTFRKALDHWWAASGLEHPDE